MFKIFEFDETKLMYGPLSPSFLNFMEHGLATAVEFHTGCFTIVHHDPTDCHQDTVYKSSIHSPQIEIPYNITHVKLCLVSAEKVK